MILNESTPDHPAMVRQTAGVIVARALLVVDILTQFVAECVPAE
jgi:hypothetical protein